jgi:CBS domain-containing protein
VAVDVELLEIRDFLRAHPPFDALPDGVLETLPKSLSVRYARRGTVFPPADADGRCLYVVRQGAVELRDARGELAMKLGEGDFYDAVCRESAESVFAGTCTEDTLLYLLPCATVDGLRRQHESFGEHFEASLTLRLKKALRALQEAPAAGAGSLGAIQVGALVGRAPICVSPDASVREAAQCMTEHRVSCALVTAADGQLLGLVTDRDLRTRCVAAGLPYDTPVRAIMTAEVHTVSPNTPGFQALMTMTRLNVHHLPVVSGERAVGVITTTDLVRHESANAVYLVGDIRKAASVDVLAALSRKLPEMQVQLALSGASAAQVGEAVAAIADAIAVRLMELAELAHGAPPVPYLWVAGGSQARREQTSHSDQDNAIILADDARPEDDAYYAAVAGFVNDGLHACGFVRCPGDVMASNAEWRQPVRRWRQYFDKWINQPEPKALMLSSVFFDLRAVRGPAGLLADLQADNLARSKDNKIFLAYMAGNALTHRPPLGFFRNFVLIAGGEHHKTLDLKHRGVVPIVDLARVYALAEGLPQVNTLERLQAAAGSLSLSREGARDLEDAWHFIATLRLRHQAGQLRRGDPADNFLAPNSLSAMERSHLKDAFAAIATMQTTLERRYPSGRFF